jgi:oligopeptide transport system substrate-binding protein
VVGDLMVGLIEDGPDGRPVPGIATSWETSRDGLTWTFHLRRASWSDGAPLTADDFVFALRRTLDPRTASPYAYLLYLLKNGEAVNGGKADPAALGARALDPQTLELTLAHPAPYLLQIAKHFSMYPVPRHAVERWGEAWAQPAHYVSDGPYRPVAWRLGDRIEVVKNPRFYDAGHVCIDRIDYYPTNDSVSAERRVLSGELDLNTSILSSRTAWLRRGKAGAYVRTHPYLGVVYLPFNGRDVPALKDRRVRQALAMSIDREFIAGKLMRAGQIPAYAFTPPGVAGYPGGPRFSWAGWTLARRQGEARRLLAQAGYGPGRPLKLELKFPNTADLLTFAPAIQADWRAVGVELELAQNEFQVAYDAFKTRDFQVGAGSWIADYDDASTFLDLMRSKTGQQNYADYANPAYDALVQAAENEPDVGRRAADLAKAEQLMLDDAPVAPLYFMVSRNLVSPAVNGWTGNALDIHRAKYLCLNRGRSETRKATLDHPRAGQD